MDYRAVRRLRNGRCSAVRGRRFDDDRSVAPSVDETRKGGKTSKEEEEEASHISARLCAVAFGMDAEIIARV